MVQGSPRPSEPRPREPLAPHPLALAILALGCALLVPLGPGETARAAPKELPGQIPRAPAYVAGFPIPFHRTADYRPRDGAVVAADLDRDGIVELVVQVPSGVITILRPDGTRLPGWPRTFETLPQPAYPRGMPGVGDLDGDGSRDVVTCVVAGNDPRRRSFLYAFRPDGADLPGWPVEVRSMAGDGSSYSCSPGGALLADLDGDGLSEVVHGMSHGEVQAFDGDGTPLPGWPFRLGPDGYGRMKEVNADLAAGDLDGDGRDEVILSESGHEPRLVALSGLGRPVPGFPKGLSEIIDRQAPAVADLDGDGIPELVQATLPYAGDVLSGGPSTADAEPASGDPAVPASLYVLRSDGSEAPGWPRRMQTGGPWGAVLADVGGEGPGRSLPEILQQDADMLFAFDASGALFPGFPLTTRRDFLRSEALDVSPWLVADMDGDSRPDLLQVQSNLYAGSAYLRVFGLRLTGQPLKGFPFEAAGLLAASRPVAVDLTGDGARDLVLLVTEGTNGGWSLVAWDPGAR